MIRVAIADDQTLVRHGFVSLLDDGDKAVQLARRARPDVFLMDIRMPGVDGIEATRRILADPVSDGVRVVVLTTFELDEYVIAAIRAGASGFLNAARSSPCPSLRAWPVPWTWRSVTGPEGPSSSRRLADAWTATPPAA